MFDDSRIPEHCTHCPVPGLCPGSSHGWMPFWGLHLHLAWGVSQAHWNSQPHQEPEEPSSKSLTEKVFPSQHQSAWAEFLYAAPLVSRALADSERKMGLHTDTERRAELGSTTGQTPAMTHCAPRGLAYLSLLETCPG